MQGREQVDYATIFKLGNSSTYVRTDALTKLPILERTSEVTRLVDDRIEINQGQLLATLSGATIRSSNGSNFDPPQQFFPAGDFQIGKRWTSRSIETNGSYRGWFESEMRVVSYEDVAVKAGVFKAYRLETKFLSQGGTRGTITFWLNPKIGTVKLVRDARRSNGQIDSFTEELISYKNG